MPRSVLILLAMIFAGCASLAVASEQNPLVEAGVPALSRAWAGEDYLQVSSVLAAGKVPLPQLTDSQGPAFFQRLTSTDNLALCRNPTLPLGQRMEACLGIIGGANAVAKQYMAATSKGMKAHREIAMQLGFLLRGAAVAVRLVNEFLPTVPKDEKYPVRMDGLKKLNDGLTEMFAGAATTLTEKNFYSSQDFSLLLDAMAETLPDVKTAFAPDYRLELQKKLEMMRAMFPAPQDARNIQRMLGELQG